MTNLRYVISRYGGSIGNHPFLIDKFSKTANSVDLSNPVDGNTAEANNATKEAYISTSFLSGLNQGRYGVLLNDPRNSFRMVCNEYPKTFTAAYDLEINWKVDIKGSRVEPNNGLAFTTEL